MTIELEYVINVKKPRKTLNLAQAIGALLGTAIAFTADKLFTALIVYLTFRVTGVL